MELDTEALALFARKGLEGGPGVPQAGEANAAKVRRVMQLTQTLSGRDFSALRILDLGCGEGVYAIEAALHGAQVLAIDARTERMAAGAACAERHGLDNVRFVQADVRALADFTDAASFDAVYCLGLLYHLDAPEVFDVLDLVHERCRRLLILDTLITEAPDVEVVHGRLSYAGRRLREHGDGDSEAVRRARVLRSIDSTFAFRFTRPALVHALHAVGFVTVLECHAPAEPGKASDRITLAALKGEAVSISTYPWINGMGESELEARLRDAQPVAD
jgi:SAM-dependent methyltransferase